jgi:hypothetical protein
MVYDRDMKALLKAVKAYSRSPAEGIKRNRQKLSDGFSCDDAGAESGCNSADGAEKTDCE